MSSQVQGGPGPAGQPLPEPASTLAYLLKHAQLELSELTGAALAPYGISGRQLAALLVLAGREPASQQQAAQRLGVDRTTMVALIDALEARSLVVRRPQEDDRRRNVVALTDAGRDTVYRASQAAAAAERQFLAPLTRDAATQLGASLRALLPPPAGSAGPG